MEVPLTPVLHPDKSRKATARIAAKGEQKKRWSKANGMKIENET